MKSTVILFILLVSCGGQIAESLVTSTTQTTVTTTTTQPPTTTTTEPMSPLPAHPHQFGTTDGHYTLVQEQEYCNWLAEEEYDASYDEIIAGMSGQRRQAEDANFRASAAREELRYHDEVCLESS